MTDETRSRRSSINELTRNPGTGDVKAMGVLFLSGVIFSAGFFTMVYFDLIQLYPRGWTDDKLKGFSLKAEYTLRYQTLLMFWLLFNIFATIFGRNKTQALNPLYQDTEIKMQFFKNVLTNSYEQIFISVISQLILASYADGGVILKYIPLVNILQLIGRIAFFAGYPLKRGFGFACTVFPNVILVFYNIYCFGSFIRLY